MRRTICAHGILLAAAWLCATPALADVTRIEVASQEPFGGLRRGEFVKIELRVSGELSPDAEAAAIPDLLQAQRNARGKVDYATHVTLIAPVKPETGNGTLLVDIPNRSRATVQALFNSPRAVPLPLGPSEPGNGFLQEQGFTVATVYWELGKDVRLPQITGADGKPASIEAAALPMVRDVAVFLARGRTDEAGTANPVRGRVKRTIGFGYSQSGRFLKSLLLAGDNRVGGRAVFDGMMILGAASGGILLRTHAGGESQAGALPTFSDPELRGVVEAPALSVADLMTALKNRGEAAPKAIFVNTTIDYFSLRASLGRTGLADADVALPPNVRMYDVAGGSHALIQGKSSCSLPYGRLDWHPVLRATLLMLDRWLAAGVAPPPNELMPLQPATAGDPLVLAAPHHLAGAMIKVPVRDADGIPIGGIRLPDVEVPLGSHAVQNPPMNFICSLAGGFAEFRKTREEREAASDPRPSLAERYKTRADYAARVRAAALALEQRGFLLPADAAVIVDDAYAVQIPAAK
jgi:hypothetical protein